MFSGLNDAARLVLRLAEVIARGRQHEAVDTEDVLLALVQLHDCVAARVLARGGIDLERARHEVATLTKREGTAAESCGWTPGVCHVVRLATAAAHDRLGHSAIGTGHLLLGLLEEANGVAFTALCRLGIGRLGGNLSRIAERVVTEMRRERPR